MEEHHNDGPSIWETQMSEQEREDLVARFIAALRKLVHMPGAGELALQRYEFAEMAHEDSSLSADAVKVADFLRALAEKADWDAQMIAAKEASTRASDPSLLRYYREALLSDLQTRLILDEDWRPAELEEYRRVHDKALAL